MTDRGRPVGVLYPIDPGALEDFVLGNAPEFVTSMREADEDVAAGRTVSLDAVLAEIDGRAAGSVASRPPGHGDRP